MAKIEVKTSTFNGKPIYTALKNLRSWIRTISYHYDGNLISIDLYNRIDGISNEIGIEDISKEEIEAVRDFCDEVLKHL